MLRHLFAAGLALLAPAATHAQPYQPPRHTQPPPEPFAGGSPSVTLMAADNGVQVERGRSPRHALAEHRKLTAALAGLQPQRKGVVDAYVVSVGLDSDPVFGREAREAGRVLGRRYDAVGRTIVLAGSDGAAESSLPMGSPDAIAATLARVAELMDADEDVLVLYTTSHGAPFGIVYNDGDQGFGAISPFRLWTTLNELGITNRLLIVSACYSGVFVPLLSSDTSVVVSAASSERTSFGCMAENDWTFFGDAMINRALRDPQPLATAFARARSIIAGWEKRGSLTPSDPQISVGAKVDRWLTPLERRGPRTSTQPVGRPATEALDSLLRRR